MPDPRAKNLNDEMDAYKEEVMEVLLGAGREMHVVAPYALILSCALDLFDALEHPQMNQESAAIINEFLAGQPRLVGDLIGMLARPITTEDDL